jgi:hypothetical protein
VSPLIVIGLAVPVAVIPSGNDVTTKELIAAPPLELGVVKLTTAWPSWATADTPLGALGTVHGVTGLEGDEAGLVPTLLDAVTVNV